MTTHNTGNAVPSVEVKDLFDNCETEDEFCNGDANTTITRIGKVIKTMAGMNADFNDFLINSGFESVHLIYTVGVPLTVNRPTQLIDYNGSVYRVKLPSSFPVNLTGVWATDAPKLLDVGDQSLRLLLALSSGAGLVGFTELSTYPANTVGAMLKYLNAPGIDKEQRSFSDLDLLPNLGDTKTLDAAIRKGVVRIALAADSIGQGDADSLYDNSSFAIVMRRLREQNPAVTFVFANFSIAGLGIPSFSNPNYKGQTPPADPFTGFYRAAGDELTCQWPGGSVVGKSWIDHIKDWTPDLVCVAFGANDIAWTGPQLETYSKTAIDAMLGWAKPPSIAWGSAAKPAIVSDYSEQVQLAANVARSVARERNLTLMDFNRLHNVRRFGVDVDDLLYLREDAFTGFPTGWTLDPGTTFALSTVTPGAIEGQGTATRNRLSQNFNLKATCVATNWATTTCGLYYRDLGTNDGTGQARYAVFVSATALSLYWRGAMLGSFSFSSIPNGTAVTIQVDVRGARHRVYLNGVKRIDVWNYGNVMQGKHGVTAVGGFAAIYAFEAHLGNKYPVGREQLTDKDIYGVNDFYTNQDSVGGNANNHFTKLGNKVIMAAGYFPLMHHIRMIRPEMVNYNASIGLSAPQAIATGGATNIAWTLEYYDDYNMHAAGSAVLIAPVPGKYLVTASLYWAATTTGIRSMLVVKNDAVEVAGATQSATASGRVRQNVTIELLLAAGETIGVRGYQDGASLLNVDSDGSRLSMRLMPN
jgi:hypothetical protein